MSSVSLTCPKLVLECQYEIMINGENKDLCPGTNMTDNPTGQGELDHGRVVAEIAASKNPMLF